MLASFPFHPLLLGIYPIFYLYSRNVMYIPPSQTWRALLLSTGVTILFLLGFRAILKDWARAGLLCSLLAILFYSFGHVASALPTGMGDADLPWGEFVLGAVWLVAFLALSFAIVRTKTVQRATGIFNLASGLLFIVPTVVTVGFAMDSQGPTAGEAQALADLRGDASAQRDTTEEPGPDAPDIYFLVLDGYERADTLLESYGYDNSGFLDSLTQRGFYVADQSRSNYLSTNYSLGSTLNLVYFQDLPSSVLRRARYSLRTNYVTEYLRQRGYRIVVFDSGTRDTNDQYADLFLTPFASAGPPTAGLNPFEVLLLRTTLARLLVGSGDDTAGHGPVAAGVRETVNQELAARRERISFALSRLPEFAVGADRDFVFADIFSPHIPFLYGPSGEGLQYFGDPRVNWYVVPPDDYLEYYRYQIDHLNQLVLEAIDGIQREATGPLVIILQSDHGDDFLLDWDNPTARGVGARSAILNAIYFSDRSYEMLYRTVTPVNTFRVVFDMWFATQYPLLPDRTFYHAHPTTTAYNSRLRFYDSCESFGICPSTDAGP